MESMTYLTYPLPLGVLGSMASFVLVTLLAFLFIILCISHLRFERLTGLVGGAEEGKEVNPSARFRLDLADRLGRGAFEQNPLMAGLLTFDGTVDVQEPLVNALKMHLRNEDTLLPLEDGRIALAVQAERSTGESVLQRLFKACHELGTEHLRAGIATCPENGLRGDDIMEAIEQALHTLDSGKGGPAYALAPLPPGATENRGPARKHPHVDPLTGVLRAERMMSSLQKFTARHRRDGKSTSVVYTAIDNVQRYTEQVDEEGMQQVVKELASVLDDGIRIEDFVARYDKYDFVFSLSVGVEEAVGVAERLADRVKDSTFFKEGKGGLKLTVSAGVAGMPDHARTAANLVDAAKAAQQMAAIQGGQRCLVYNRSMRAATLADGPVDAL